MAKKTNYESNGKSYYRVRIDLTSRLGYKPDGKRNVKTFYGSSKREAENKRDEYLKELDSGVSLDNEPLGKLMENWLFITVLHSRKPSTVEKYEGIYRLYIYGSNLYSKPVKKIKSIDLENYYIYLLDKGKSIDTIKSIHKLVKSFFNHAIKQDLILKNPCNNVSLPKNNIISKSINEDLLVFTDDEIQQFQNINANPTLKNIIFTALLTGLRLGELLALNISDIDLCNQQIFVNKSIKRVKIFKTKLDFTYKTIIQPPKTTSSNRTVPFPEVLIPIIKNQIIIEKEKHLKLGLEFKNDNILFSTCTCEHMDNRNLRKAYERFLKRGGMEHKSFHKLRHTYATKLFEQGVPLETVNALLGHNGDKTITKIYVHVTSQTKQKAVQKINHILTTKF